MKFIFTPEEARGPAFAVAKYLTRQRMSVKVEIAAWPDAPYRTTLTAKKSGLYVLVEAQGTPNYTKPLRDLWAWLAAKRHYAELYLATLGAAVLEASMLAELQRDGVGLLIVEEDGRVVRNHSGRNPALIVTPEPTLSYGDCKAEVARAVEKFNDGERKDGLRDMCELVERETERIAVLTSKKQWIRLDEQSIKKMNWENQINMLASSNSYDAGRQPILGPSLKDDFHSFRGARNLLDHKARTKRDEKRRQRQFAERMMMGPRLIAELISIRRKIK